MAFRGEAPEGKGFWFPCTLVEATNDDRVAREEVFGPVAAVIPFEDEADAIRIANDTPYGLSGSIWTRDGARALRVTRALETGVLSVNSNSSVRVSTPFGGFKQSGFGRELGMQALRATRRSRTCSSRRTTRGRRGGKAGRQGLRDHGGRRWDGPRGGGRLHRRGGEGLCRDVARPRPRRPSRSARGIGVRVSARRRGRGRP